MQREIWDLCECTRGQYDTDISNIREGYYFPSLEVRGRNIRYSNNMRLYTGEYAKDKKLVAMVNGKREFLDYRILPLSYFSLIVNKLESLIFSNSITVRTGDVGRDQIVNDLIESTYWLNSIRKGVKLCEIYGDCIIKTYRNGASATCPRFGYKVVEKSDKSEVRLYVLREILYDEGRDLEGVFKCRASHI